MCILGRLRRCVGITMETNMQPLAISIYGAAQALGIGRSTIYVLLNSGRLEAFKIGRRTLVTTSSIARFAANQQQETRPERLLSP